MKPTSSVPTAVTNTATPVSAEAPVTVSSVVPSTVPPVQNQVAGPPSKQDVGMAQQVPMDSTSSVPVRAVTPVTVQGAQPVQPAQLVQARPQLGQVVTTTAQPGIPSQVAAQSLPTPPDPPKPAGPPNAPTIPNTQALPTQAPPAVQALSGPPAPAGSVGPSMPPVASGSAGPSVPTATPSSLPTPGAKAPVGAQPPAILASATSAPSAFQTQPGAPSQARVQVVPPGMVKAGPPFAQQAVAVIGHPNIPPGAPQMAPAQVKARPCKKLFLQKVLLFYFIIIVLNMFICN